MNNKTHNFKIGDVVILQKPNNNCRKPEPYVVTGFDDEGWVEGDTPGRGWHHSLLELHEIVNSPLYLAMKENKK